MAELIKVQRNYPWWVPLLFNGALTIASGICLLQGLSDWQLGKRDHTITLLSCAIASSVLVDTINRFTKDAVATQQLIKSSETRLISKLIAAQEYTQSADLEASSKAKLSQLGVTRTQSEVSAAYQIAELETDYQNAVSRLQEFDLHDGD